MFSWWITSTAYNTFKSTFGGHFYKNTVLQESNATLEHIFSQRFIESIFKSYINLTQNQLKLIERTLKRKNTASGKSFFLKVRKSINNEFIINPISVTDVGENVKFLIQSVFILSSRIQ